MRYQANHLWPEHVGRIVQTSAGIDQRVDQEGRGSWQLMVASVALPSLNLTLRNGFATKKCAQVKAELPADKPN